MISLPATLNHALLRLIGGARRPIGQGALNLLLRRHGFSVSTPTVGRRLQALEFSGLLRKISVDGRVITPRGVETLKRWDTEARLRGSSEALFETLRRGDKKHILELLAARRVIESDTAALAAQHASPSAIRRMSALLRAQAVGIEGGGLGIEEDIAFHREIARAAGNEVLHSLVTLLRDHGRYDVIIASMRAIVGSRLVVEHAEILDAIRARNPEAARNAMRAHIESLQRDLDRYWNRYARQATSPKER